jgi:radical SAM protein with 4Fe4S-binding SPASM domain
MDLERHPTIDAALFAAQTQPALQKRLFGTYVDNINLELFDYCNRQCSYCPVALVDRRSAVRHMPDAQLHCIIDDLCDIDYRRAICLNLFNEPLADPRTLEVVRLLRDRLPAARVWFNSNGDYLTRRAVEQLAENGLKRIVVTLHVAAEASYDDAQQITRISQLSARTGLTFQVVRFRPGTDIRAEARFRGMEITIKSVNYDQHGVNRAGSLDHIPVKHSRQSPCDRPFHDVTIAWNGDVYPCCQFMEGIAAHDAFVVGRIDRPGALFALYCSEMMSSFRRDNFGYGDKRAPCDTCADRDRCRGDGDVELRRAWAERHLPGGGLDRPDNGVPR